MDVRYGSRRIFIVLFLVNYVIAHESSQCFSSRSDIPVVSNLQSYASGVVCDVLGDGTPVIVLPNSRYDDPHILKFVGPGIDSWADMTGSWFPSFPFSNWGGPALCQDINNDGHMDLVFMTRDDNPYATVMHGPPPFTIFQTFSMWTGTPPSPPPFQYGTSGVPYMGAIGDFNCDGYIDIIADLENRGVVFCENIMDVMFHSVTAFGGLVQWSGQGDYGGVADISNDGYVDIVTRQDSSFTNTWISIPNLNGTVNTFDSSVNPFTIHRSNQYGGVCFADFWKRGKLDIVFTGDNTLSTSYQPGLYRSDDDGQTWYRVLINPQFDDYTYTWYGSIVCEDFNNDGYADIAVSSANSYYTGRMRVFLNDLANTNSFTYDGSVTTSMTYSYGGGLMAVDYNQSGSVSLFLSRYRQSPRAFENGCASPCTGIHIRPLNEQGSTLVNARVELHNDSNILIAGVRETHGGWSHGSQPYNRLHFGLGDFDPQTETMYITVKPSCGGAPKMFAICAGTLACGPNGAYEYDAIVTQPPTPDQHLDNGICDALPDHFVWPDWRLPFEVDVLANDGLIYNTPLNVTDLRVNEYCEYAGCSGPAWGTIMKMPNARKRASGDLVMMMPGTGAPPSVLYFTYQICHELIPDCCQMVNVTVDVTPPCTVDPSVCDGYASTCGVGSCNAANITSDAWGCVYFPTFSGDLEPNCTINGYSCASGFCHPDGFCKADFNDGICYIDRCAIGFCDPFNATGHVQPITGCGGVYNDSTPCQDLNANLSMSSPCYGNATCQSGVCVLSDLNDAECSSEYVCWQSGTCGGDPNDWFLKPIAWIAQEGGDRNDNNVVGTPPYPGSPLAPLYGQAATIHNLFGYRVAYLAGDIIINDPLAYRFHLGAFIFIDGVFWVIDAAQPGMLWVYRNTLENSPRFAKADMITIQSTDLPLVDQVVFNDTLAVGEPNSAANEYNTWQNCIGMDAWVDTENNKQWVVCAGTTGSDINSAFGIARLFTMVFFERNNVTGEYTINTVLTELSGTLTSLTLAFDTEPSVKPDSIKGWNGVAVLHMSSYAYYGGWPVTVNDTTNEQCQWWQTFRYNATLDSWSEVSYWNNTGNCNGLIANIPYNRIATIEKIPEFHDMQFTLAGLQVSVWNGIAAHLIPNHDMYSNLAPSPVMGIWDISVTPPSFIQALQIGQDNLTTVSTSDVRNATRYTSCMGDGFLVVARMCTLESRPSIDCLWVYEWDGTQFTNEQQLTYPERNYFNQTTALYKYISCDVDENRIVAMIMRSNNFTTEALNSNDDLFSYQWAYIEYYHRTSFLGEPNIHFNFIGARQFDSPYGPETFYNTDSSAALGTTFGSQITLGEGVDYQFAFVGCPAYREEQGSADGQGIVVAVCLDFQDGCTRGCEVAYQPYYPNPVQVPENFPLNTQCTAHLVDMCFNEDTVCVYGDCRINRRNQTCVPDVPAVDSDCCLAWCDTYIDCISLIAPTGWPCVNDNTSQCEQDATCQAFTCVRENGGTCEFDHLDTSGTCINATNGCYVGMCNGVDDFCANQVYTPSRCVSLYGGPFGNGEFTARSYQSCPNDTTVVLSFNGCEVNCIMDESYVDAISNDIQCPTHPGCGYDPACPSKGSNDAFFCDADVDCTGYLLTRECVEARCIAKICTYAPLPVNTVCNMTNISANLSCTGTAGKCDGRGSCVPDVFTLPENTCYDVCGFSACNDGLWYTDFDSCTTEYKCMGYPNAIVIAPTFGNEFLGSTPGATVAFANNNVSYPGNCFWNYECSWGTAQRSTCAEYCSYTAGPGPIGVSHPIIPNEYYCRHDICNMAPRGICSLETFECLGNVTTPNPICTDPGCYIKVVIVVDTTNSLSLAEKQVILQSMQTVIPISLAGTFATVAIVPFGGYAYSLCTYNRMDTISGINDYLDCVDNVYRDNVTLNEIAGFTNWASAFSIVANSIAAPELVIFFSDGSPNRYEDANFDQIERVRVRGTVIRGICVASDFTVCQGFSEYIGTLNVDWKYAPTVNSVAQTMADIIHEQNITGCEPYNPPCEMITTNNITCECDVVPDPSAVNQTCYSGDVCIYDGICDNMGNCLPNTTAPDGTPCDPDPPTACGSGVCSSGMCNITTVNPSLCANVTAVDDCFFTFPNVVANGTVIDVLANDLGDIDPNTLTNITTPSPVGRVEVDMGVFRIYDLPTMMSGNITFTYQICGINPLDCDTAIVCINFTIPSPCMNGTYNCSDNPTTECISSWICMDGILADINGCTPVFEPLGTNCTGGIEDCAMRQCNGADICEVVSTNHTYCMNVDYPCLSGQCVGAEAANYTHERIGIIRCPNELLPPVPMQIEYNQTEMFLTHKVVDQFLFWGQVNSDREIGRLVIYKLSSTTPIHYEYVQVFQQGNCEPAYLNFKSNAIAGDVAPNGDILATVFLDSTFFPIGLSNNCNYTLQDMRYANTSGIWTVIGYEAVGPATFKCRDTINVDCILHGSVQWEDLSVQLVECENGPVYELRFGVRRYNASSQWEIVDDGIMVVSDMTNVTVTGFDVVGDRVLITLRNDTGNSAIVYVYRENSPDVWTLDFSSTPISATSAPNTTFESGWPGACMGDRFFIQNLDVAPDNIITNGVSPMDSFMLFVRISESPDVWDSGVVYSVPDAAIYNSTLRSTFACDVYGDTILAAQAWPSVDGFTGKWLWNNATSSADFADVFGIHTGPADDYIEPNIGVQLSISSNPIYAFVTTTYSHTNVTLPDRSDQINIYCIDPLSSCTYGCDNFFNDGADCVDTVTGNAGTICDTGFCVAGGHTDMFTNITECEDMITDPFCVSVNKTTPCFGCEYQTEPDGQVHGPGVDELCQFIYCTDGVQSFGVANDSLCIYPPSDCWTGVCDVNNSISVDGCTYTPKPEDTPCTVGGETTCEMSACDDVGNCLFGQNSTLCFDGNDCTWDVCCEGVCSNVDVDHGGRQNYFWGPYESPQTAAGTGTLPFAALWVEESPTVARMDGQIGWNYTITAPSDVLPSPLSVKTRRLKLDLGILERLIVTFTITDLSTQSEDSFRNTHIVGIQNTDNVTYSDVNRVCLEIFSPNYDYGASANVTGCENVTPLSEASQMLMTNSNNMTVEYLGFIVEGPVLTTGATEIYLEHRAEAQGTSDLHVDVLVSVYIEAIIRRGCEGDFNCSDINVCDMGTCVGGPPPECYFEHECGIGFCNVSTNACDMYYVPEGTSCKDDDYCSVNETCQNVMGNLTCAGVFVCPDNITVCGEATCAPNTVSYNVTGTNMPFDDELRSRLPGMSIETNVAAVAFSFFNDEVRVACAAADGLDLANPFYPQFPIASINVTRDARFGADTAITGDGAVVVIGAPGSVNEVVGFNYYPLNYPYPAGLPPIYANRSGDVFIYVKTSLPSDFENCTYEFQQKLLPVDMALDSQFGWAVAASEDSNVVVVGGPGHNGGMGAAWVFIRNSTTGFYQQTGAGGALSFSGAVGTEIMFGTSVAISSDGTYLAVGAPGDDSKRGAVWIFSGTSASSAWIQVGSKLVGSAGLGSPMEMQGRSVSMSTLGYDLVVGGSMNTFEETPGTDLGSVWVWRRISAMVFSETYLITPGTEFNLGGTPLGYVVGNFGSSVSISDNGLILGVSGREINSTAPATLGRTVFYYRFSVNEAFMYSDVDVDFGYRVRVAGSGAAAVMGSHTFVNVAFMVFGVGDCLNITYDQLCDDGDGKTCTYGNCTGAIDECVQYINATFCEQFVTECMPVVVCDPSNGTADFVDPLTGCAFFFASDNTSCNGGLTGECTTNSCQLGICVPFDDDTLCDDSSTCTDDTCNSGVCEYVLHDLWSPCNDLGFNCTPGYCDKLGFCHYTFNHTFCINEPCFSGECNPLVSHDPVTGCTIALADGEVCYPNITQCYSNATCLNGFCIPSGTFDDNVCTPDPLDTCVISGSCTGENDFLQVVHTLSVATNGSVLYDEVSYSNSKMYANVVVGDYILVATLEDPNPLHLYTVPNDDATAAEILIHERVAGFKKAEWGLIGVYGKPVTSCNGMFGQRTRPVAMEHAVTSDGKQWILKKNLHDIFISGTYPFLNITSSPSTYYGWELDIFEWYGNGTLRYDSTVVPTNQTDICMSLNMHVYGDLVLMGIYAKCLASMPTPLMDTGGVCNPMTSVRYFPSNGTWLLTNQYNPFYCNTENIAYGFSDFLELYPLLIGDNLFYVFPRLGTNVNITNQNEIMVFDLLPGDLLSFNQKVSYVDIVGYTYLAIISQYAKSYNNTSEILVSEYYNRFVGFDDQFAGSPWYIDFDGFGVAQTVHVARPVLIKWNGTDLIFSERLEFIPPKLLFDNGNSTFDDNNNYVVAIYNADLVDSLLLCAYRSQSFFWNTGLPDAEVSLLNEMNSYVAMFVRASVVDEFDFVAIMDPYTGVPFPNIYQAYYLEPVFNINTTTFVDGGFLFSTVVCDESFAYITVGGKDTDHGQNTLAPFEAATELFVFCIRPEGCSQGCTYTYEPDFTPCTMYPPVSCLTQAECFNHECQTLGVSPGEPIINHPDCIQGIECEATVCVDYMGCMNICPDFFAADVVIGPNYRENSTFMMDNAVNYGCFYDVCFDSLNTTIPCNGTSNYTCIDVNECILQECTATSTNGECNDLNTECIAYDCDLDQISPPGINTTSGCYPSIFYGSETPCTYTETCVTSASCDLAGGCNVTGTNQTICDAYAQSVGGTCNYAICDVSDPERDPITGCVLKSNDTICEEIHTGFCVTNTYCNNTDPLRNLTDSCVVETQVNGSSCNVLGYTCTPGQCSGEDCFYIFNDTVCNQEPCNNGTCNPFAMEFDNTTGCEDNFSPIGTTCMPSTLCSNFTCQQIIAAPANHTECNVTHFTAGTPCQVNTSSTCENSVCDGVDTCVFNATDTLCDDANVCTDDACMSDGFSLAICAYGYNSDPCTVADMGSDCENSTCVSGVCELGGIDSLCDDMNVCTDNVCEVNITANTAICSSSNNTDPCDTDSFQCTYQVCTGAECISFNNDTYCEYLNSTCTAQFFCDPTFPGHSADGCNVIYQPVLTPCTIDPLNDCEMSTCNGADVCEFASNSGLCNDMNECTTEVCMVNMTAQTAVCNYTNVAGSCTYPGESGDCLDSMCNEGVCELMGNNATCDDANPCTDEFCLVNATTITASCQRSNNTEPCDTDSFSCTSMTCGGGECNIFRNDTYCEYLLGPCVDYVFCNETEVGHMIDGCNVVFLPDLTPCPFDGGNTCESSYCDTGVCIFDTDPLLCDDSNGCTDEICNSNATEHTAICVYMNNTDPCSYGVMGSNCENSTCSGGVCVLGGSAAFCFDGNVCTDDVCTTNETDSTAICSNPNNTGPCDDGYTCTTNQCGGGTCNVTVYDDSVCSNDFPMCWDDIVCNQTGPHLNTTTGCSAVYSVDGTTCSFSEGASDCESSSCMNGTCVLAYDNGLCDDNNYCTVDICNYIVFPLIFTCDYVPMDSLCSDLADGLCVTGGICNTTDPNAYPPGNPRSGCVPTFEPENTTCTLDPMNNCEDSKCNVTGSCNFAGNDGFCDDSNECTDDVCNTNTTTFTALCGYTNNTNNCTDDGIVCTLDYCSMAECIHPPDDTFCTYLQTNCTTDVFCDNSSMNADVNGCDADRLPPGSFCVIDESNTCEDSMCILSGVCAFGSDVGLCDDSNECTADMCAANITELTANCTYQNLTGPSCTLIGATGDCLAPTCENGVCQFAGDDSLCDDGNPCTDDVCVTNATALTAICTFINNDTNTCVADAFGCTDDVCISGTCTAVNNDTNCDYLDGNCTISFFCDPLFVGHLADGCNANFSSIGTPCYFDTNNDCENSVCSGMQSCEFASNSGLCDDANVCTDEVCNVNMTTHIAVCAYTNNTDPCSIAGGGSDCEDSMCLGGDCVLGGDSLICDDANECTDDVCQVNTTAVTAICMYTNNVNNCTDDGFNCTTDVCDTGVCTHPPQDSFCNYLDGQCTITFFCNTTHMDMDAMGCVGVFETPGTPCEINSTNTCENSQCMGGQECEFGTNATLCEDPWDCTGNTCVVDVLLMTAVCDTFNNHTYCLELFGNNTCLNTTFCFPNNTMEPIGCINDYFPDDTPCNTTVRECAVETCQSAICEEELFDELCEPVYNCTVPVCELNGTCSFIPMDSMCVQYTNDCANATCAPQLENGPPGSGCYITYATNGSSCMMTDGGMDSCELGSYCNATGGCVVQVDPFLCWQHPCMPSMCDTESGLCIDSTDPDGTPCDTDDATCTVEVCSFGLCEFVEYNHTVCEFLGIPQCNLNGTCNPMMRDANDTTLGCMTTFQPTDYPCNITSGECEASGCDAGECVYAEDSMLCDDANECTLNVCTNTSCEYPNQVNGFFCDDGNSSTCVEVCIEGSCDAIVDCESDVVFVPAYADGMTDLSTNDIGVDMCLINATGFTGNIIQTSTQCNITVQILPCDFSNYTITYRACNGTYDACCLCNITIAPESLFLIQAVDDVLETQAMMTELLDVLANDMGPIDPSTLEVDGCLETYPCAMAWGNVSVTMDNQLLIEVDNDAGCEYNFTYTVCDNTTCNNCANATVFLHISPFAMNDTGSAVATSNITVNVTANDKGVIANCSSTALVLIPDWSYSFDGYPNCLATIIPKPCDVGTIDIEYTICSCANGTLCDNATITFTVTDGPSVTAIDDGAMTYVNMSVNIDVLLNDLGPVDASTLNITVFPTNGNITSINYMTGVITYAPNSSFVGMDMFEYEICDQPDRCHCDRGIVNIIVLVEMGNYMVMDDCFEGFQNITTVGYPLLNDGPPDAYADSFVILVTSPDGLSEFNSTTQVFSFTPFDPDFSGVTYITYVVCSDMANMFCDSAVIKIYIIPSPITIEPMPCGEDRLPLVHYYDSFPCIVPYL